MKNIYFAIITVTIVVAGVGAYFLTFEQNNKEMNPSAHKNTIRDELLIADWLIKASDSYPERVTSGELYTSAYTLLKKEHQEKPWGEPRAVHSSLNQLIVAK